MALKDRIKKLREEHGITYKEIAYLAGIKYGTFRIFMEVEDRRLRVESERSVERIVGLMEEEIERGERE